MRKTAIRNAALAIVIGLTFGVLTQGCKPNTWTYHGRLRHDRPWFTLQVTSARFCDELVATDEPSLGTYCERDSK